MTVYLASGGAYLALLFTRGGVGEGWGATFLLTVVFAAWITIVNLLYLLVQVVIAAEDCSVAAASRQVAAFLRRSRASVVGVFLAVTAIAVFASIASLLATAALPGEDEDSLVIKLAVLVYLDAQVLPRAQPCAPGSRQTGQPLPAAGFRAVGDDVLEIGMQPIGRAVVAALPRRKHRPQHLHVLLRHRPRSIPQAQESA